MNRRSFKQSPVAARESGLTNQTTFVVNAGSASHKFALIANDGTRHWEGRIDWVSDCDHGIARHRRPGDEWQEENLSVRQGKATALKPWLKYRIDALEADASIPAVKRVGHRIVHGGEYFQQNTRLDEKVVKKLEQLIPLAPLHNSVSVETIGLMLELCPDLPQNAVFDTAFHRTIPEERITYGLPDDWRKEGIRRYGFHGISHGHLARTIARAKKNDDLRVVSLHLGGGCSMCAIRGLESRDTSMGFTPLEGLVMGSRAGSFDPEIILFKLRQGMSPGEINEVLQKHSGLVGLSGISADIRQVRLAADNGNERARLALDVFFTALVRYIGSAIAVLQGVDVVALTGGIGENDSQLHDDLIRELGWLGVTASKTEPNHRKDCFPLSAPGKVELWVVRADEEGAIAREAQALTCDGRQHEAV